MPQNINLNVSPYYDDYNPIKDFYRVLFRPGYSIQARELSSLQSILQNQIENLSRSKFKQGSVVVPGEIIFDDKYNYVKISSFTNNLSITDFIGKTVKGSISGVSATIVNATAATTTDSATIFVKYNNSGTSNTSAVFSEGETLIADSQGNPSLVVGVTGSVIPTTSSAIGVGCAVTVQEGVYFINGFLVKNSTETIIANKYSNKTNAKVGFVITESLVTPEEDLSLLDNAQGYSNFSAPGAHRLKITVSLTSKALDYPDTNDFVELLILENGTVKRTNSTDSTNPIIDILAQRTYDESGDYIVKDFSYSVKEHLLSGNNNGIYTANQGGNANKFIIALNPGKAYVKGFQIEKTSISYVEVDKARDTFSDTASLTALEGSNFYVKNLFNIPDIQELTTNLAGAPFTSTSPYQEINFYSQYSDLLGGDTSSNVDSSSPLTNPYFWITIKSLSGTTVPAVGTSCNIGGTSNVGTIRFYSLSQSNTFANVIVEKTNAGFTITQGQSFTFGAISSTIITVESLGVDPIGIAKTKYLKFLSGSSDSNLVYNLLNSQFKLGLFGFQYFTKIKCKNSVSSFAIGGSIQATPGVGTYIIGQTSGAFGVIEYISSAADTAKDIIVSNVRGNFIPGETITQELIAGNTSSQFNVIENNNTINYLKPISTGSGYSASTISGVKVFFNGVLQSSIGSGNLNITSGRLTNIDITQTARDAAGIFTSTPTVTISGGTISGVTATYQAILHRDTVYTYDSSSVRSFYASASAGNTIVGDIASIDNTTQLGGGGTFSATEGSYFISADNIAARPDLELKKNDLIQVIDDAGVSRKYLVLSVSSAGTPSTAQIYVRGAIASTFTNKQIAKIKTALQGASQDTLLLPLPNNNVSTAVLNPSSTGISYTIQKEFVNQLDSNGTVSLALGTNQTFLGFTTDNYIFTDVTNNSLIDLSGTGVVTFSNSNSTITINFGAIGKSSTYANHFFKLIAPVQLTNTVPKTKTLVQNQQYTVSTNIDAGIIPLPFADGYKLTGIYMSLTGASPTTSDLNITDRFDFDGGQRDNYYDLARIVRKPGTVAPTQQFLVVFDYFKHSSSGDYFTVDSYTNTDYAAIPRFNSKVYGDICLSDYFDFRPRVSNFLLNDATTTQLPGYTDKSAVNAIKFNSTSNSGASGASYSKIPIYGSLIQTGYKYYLNRIDALYLTKDGIFTISKGNPSTNPQTPSVIDNAMLLQYINIPAYTYKTSDVQIKPVDNSRYTMKDIGNLKTRIEKLEYFSVLSMVEQDTFNTQIRDQYNNERFKNGILVDNFEGHNVGDTTSDEYSCSIDTQSGLLRPAYAMSQTKLEESIPTQSSRSANRYQKTGDLITLPYTESTFITVSAATKYTSVCPGQATKFTGVIKLSPNLNEWKDTSIAPELIINDNSVFDSIKNQGSSSWGSLWNEWQFAWTGISYYGLANSTNSNSNTSTNQVYQFQSSSSNVISATTRTRSRNGSQNRTNPYGSSISTIGQKSISTAYNPYIQSSIVKFVATGLKANTQLYAFFDGIDVNPWINPDNVSVYPFTGIAGYAQKGFGTPIITDSNGNISGIFLIPAGYPPNTNKTILDINSIDYSTFFNTGAQTRRFTAGDKTFRLISSSTNLTGVDAASIETFVEAEYVVAGLQNTSSDAIQSTRFSPYSRRNLLSDNTVQYNDIIKTNLTSTINYVDPLSQSFSIEGYSEGLFVTSLDLYFQNKSDTRPVTVYVVSTENGIPTYKILPFSQKTLNPDTILRIKTSNNNSVTFGVDEIISGITSGASGTIKVAQTVNNSSVRYNLILKNHNGISFLPGEQIVINRNPQITNVNFYIDSDSGYVEKINVTSFGSAYTASGTTVSLLGDNAGGVVPVLTPSVYDGKIYNVSVGQNSGYYSAPTVVINGGDATAKATAIFKVNNPAVKMGIATSADASIKTTFTFDSPVYLQNNTKYAFVIATDSSDHKIYTARVGDNLLNSSNVATAKPYVGSIFKSQNSAAWVEDQIEDVKFNLNRAVFTTNTNGSVDLKNSNLNRVILPENPIEVSNTVGTSSLFGSNSRVVRIHHPNHGMKLGDVVILSGVIGVGATGNILGMPASYLNGFFNIGNVGIDDYTIFIPDSVWTSPVISNSGRGGGINVTATTNKLFQVLYPQISTLEFNSTSVAHSIQTTYGNAVDYTSTGDYTLTSSYENISPGDNYYFTNSRIIASQQNEAYHSGPVELNGKNTLNYNIIISTTNDNVSPIIDLERTNVITIGNRVDNPTGTEKRFGTKTQILTVPGGTGYDPTTGTQIVDVAIINYTGLSGGVFGLTVGSSSRLVQGGVDAQIVSVDAGNRVLQLIDVNGGLFSALGNSSPITQSSSGSSATINSVVYKKAIVTGWDGTSQLTVKVLTDSTFQTEDIIRNFAGSSPYPTVTVSGVTNAVGFLYVDNTQSVNTSVTSKYVTKEVTMATAATALQARTYANLFANSDIKLYYKVKPDGSTKKMSELQWNPFNGTGYSDNDSTTVPTTNKALSSSIEDVNSYLEYVYSANNLTSFKSFAIKIVFTPSNPALAPRLEDLRVVAHS